MYESQKGTLSKAGCGGNRNHPAARWHQHAAGCLSRNRDYSAHHLLSGRVVPDAYLLEDGRRADEADRHDQFHEEHGLGRGTVEVVTVASPLADGLSERLGMLSDVQPRSV